MHRPSTSAATCIRYGHEDGWCGTVNRRCVDHSGQAVSGRCANDAAQFAPTPDDVATGRFPR